LNAHTETRWKIGTYLYVYSTVRQRLHTQSNAMCQSNRWHRHRLLVQPVNVFICTYTDDLIAFDMYTFMYWHMIISDEANAVGSGLQLWKRRDAAVCGIIHWSCRTVGACCGGESGVAAPVAVCLLTVWYKWNVLYRISAIHWGKYAQLIELINNFSLSQWGSLSQIHPGHQIRTIAGASNRCTMPPIYIEVLAVFIFSQQTRQNPQRSGPSCWHEGHRAWDPREHSLASGDTAEQ